MIKVTGKAKLRTIEVSDYVTQIKMIRELQENLIAFNKDAEIQVYSGYVILECKLCPTSLDYLTRHYELTKLKTNKYQVK